MSSIKEILLLLISMALVISCSAIKNAMKDAAQNVGQEMSEKVDNKIEDKLSSATDYIDQKLADIDALKDELKSELDAAITDLRPFTSRMNWESATANFTDFVQESRDLAFELTHYDELVGNAAGYSGKVYLCEDNVCREAEPLQDEN